MSGRGLEFLDKAISDGLALAMDTLMNELEAECDVCGRSISRAEGHVARDMGITFGCLACTLDRLQNEAPQPKPETTPAPEPPRPVKEPVTLKRPVLTRPTAETTRPTIDPKRVKATVRGQAIAPPAPEPTTVDGASMEMEPEEAPPPKPQAEPLATCGVCGRPLPERLLPMHRANCERAAGGIT